MSVNNPPDLSAYQALSEKGQNDGYASLDSGGDVPLSQLGNVPAATPSLYHLDAAGTSTTNTTSETTHFTKPIASADLAVGSTYRLTMAGLYTNNSGAGRSVGMKVKVGEADVWFVDLITNVTDTPHRWQLEVVFTVTGASSQKLFARAFTTRQNTDMGQVATSTANNARVSLGVAGSASVSTASAITLAVSFTHSAASTDLIMATNMAMLERLA